VSFPEKIDHDRCSQADVRVAFWKFMRFTPIFQHGFKDFQLCRAERRFKKCRHVRSLSTSRLTATMWAAFLKLQEAYSLLIDQRPEGTIMLSDKLSGRCRSK